MKRIVRLTESDLVKLVKRVISEQTEPSPDPNCKVLNLDEAVAKKIIEKTTQGNFLSGLAQNAFTIRYTPEKSTGGNLILEMRDSQSWDQFAKQGVKLCLGNLLYINMRGTNFKMGSPV
jgi:hypothetical protein